MMFRRCLSSSNNFNNKLSVIFSKETDIYFNLALENYLLNNYDRGVLNISRSNVPVVYLWRNTPSVIIGRNQNIWSECNLVNIKDDNVKPVRRFTGGGAVYQDLGNTCFTFISDVSNYNFDNNSKLICTAIGNLIGQKCELMGRNDLCVNGMKFSGAAFKVLPNAALHHGTLLINVNRGSLDKYLTPDKSKLVKHNVKSVKSRVTNLQQFKADTSHDEVCSALINEIAKHYNVCYKDTINIDQSYELFDDSFTSCYNKLTDEKWIYGNRHLDCKLLKTRFDFGSMEFCVDVSENSIVEGVWIYSDCLNADFIDYLNVVFNEKQFSYDKREFIDILDKCNYNNCDGMLKAVKDWFTTLEM